MLTLSVEPVANFGSLLTFNCRLKSSAVIIEYDVLTFLVCEASLMRSTDISVEESEDLPRILDPLANESAAAFAGSRGDSLALPAIVSAIESACVPLLRLQVSRSPTMFHEPPYSLVH